MLDFLNYIMKKFQYSKKIEGLLTKKQLLEYLNSKDKSKIPPRNYLLVNEITEDTKNLLVKVRNF